MPDGTNLQKSQSKSRQNLAPSAELQRSELADACTWFALERVAASSGVGSARRNGRATAWALTGLDKASQVVPPFSQKLRLIKRKHCKLPSTMNTITIKIYFVIESMISLHPYVKCFWCHVACDGKFNMKNEY